MTKERKVRLKTLNPYITCRLCRGYLVDPTTVVECLHTFCKSCLVKHLSEKNTCPTCKAVIHQSHPLQYVSFDRTMQDIVYKLVPGMEKNERRKIIEFHKSKKLPIPEFNDDLEDCLPEHEKIEKLMKDLHRSDEQVAVLLEPTAGQDLRPLRLKYISVSTHATITHLKKLLALKVLRDINMFHQLDVLCNNELLGKDHTLKFVCLTRWRKRTDPLHLHYRRHVQIHM